MGQSATVYNSLLIILSILFTNHFLWMSLFPACFSSIICVKTYLLKPASVMEHDVMNTIFSWATTMLLDYHISHRAIDCTQSAAGPNRQLVKSTVLNIASSPIEFCDIQDMFVVLCGNSTHLTVTYENTDKAKGDFDLLKEEGLTDIPFHQTDEWKKGFRLVGP